MKILSELKEYAQSEDIPIVQAETMDFILDFLEKTAITSVLEIGTAIGYSAIAMSTVKSVQRIVTLERNYGYAQIADVNIGRAGKDQVIEVIHQEALDYRTDEHFDLLFIDGAKAQYQAFFDRFIANVDYVIVDNIDFHGMVENQSLTHNRSTRALVKRLAKFKENILNDEDYKTRYYSIGDGVLLISKKQRRNR